MNEAVIYNGQKINFNDLFDLTLDTVENGPIELEYDFCQIRIDELLEGIDRSLIAEVWEVCSIENKSSVGQHVALLKNGFHLCTCILLIDSGVDEMMDALVNNELFVKGKSQENNDSILDASNILLFSNVAESWNTIKCASYESEQVTEGVQVIEDVQVTENMQVVEDDDFLEYEEVIRNDQFVEGDQIIEHTQNSETTYFDVQNSLRHIGKGRPTKMRIKSAIEKNKKVKTASDNSHHTSQCRCSVCKSKGHDKQNCPNK
ncbi:protein far1-related sequence 5-like [Gigaspora margarita]|uniref:Protein far1-related sequence 5-like n=1 Tax=Gigaspora margarita TaxID=4874 RepID=A0A8H4EIG6_GIGMA|nr:protein far1-related sequence 5-like [Gigaspora margarita]